MKRQLTKRVLVPITGFLAASLFWQPTPLLSVHADDPVATADRATGDSDEVLQKEEDGWKAYNSPRGRILRRELTIYPMEDSPAVDPIRVLPKDEEMRDANAAIWYLKALGFLEQTAAQESIARFHSEQAERFEKDSNFRAAPWSWLETPPSELPIQEVKKYLSYSDFQRDLLHHAARCRNFDLDRNIRAIENVMWFLIPEIQAMRQLGRDQSLRCRLAIAEGDFKTARSVIGENFQLARHLSEEPFLVSTLVGNANAQSALDDALYLVVEPSSPNLYWAIAEVPNPLVDPSTAVELELDWLFQQVPPLRKIDVVPLTDMDWSGFLNEVLPKMVDECELAKRFQSAGILGATLYIASAGAEVDSYLVNECGLTTEQLNALPETQAFFLAVRRMYEAASQEAAQLYYAPESAKESMISKDRERQDQIARQYPVLSDTIEWVSPRFVRPVVQARWRLQQRLALLQTIEALRDHLATHDSHWPTHLSELALPAPHDPVTGEPFAWSVEDETATITAAHNGTETLEMILDVGTTQKPASDTPVNKPTVDESTTKWHVSLQIDGHSSVSSVVFDRILDRLTPSERSVWNGIQQSVKSAGEDSSSVGSELLQNIFPAFLSGAANSTDEAVANQLSGVDESLRPALESVNEFSIRWAVALPESFRRVVAETHPSINLDSNADESLAWIEDVKWVAIGVDTNRGVVRATIECQNNEAAKIVRAQLPHVFLVLYQHFVDSAAHEFPAKSADLFTSEVTDDQVAFTVGGNGQNPDGLISLIRLVSVGLQSSLNERVKSKMSALILAVHNYHSAFERLPPFATKTDAVKRQGLSWRVFLLPFLGEGELYHRFHLNEPWDSEHNRKLVQEIPAAYQPPMGATASDLKEGLTTLLAPVGNSTPFLGGKDEHGFRQVIDGLSNTVAIVEVRPELAVPWTKPADYDYDEQHPSAGLMNRGGRAVIALGDGWAGTVPIDASDKDWRSLFTIDGREPTTIDVSKLRD